MQNNFHYASIIIDDPLLRENYGYLNYRKLLDLMDKYNFCTTIAFIPWNYRRTEKKIADLFCQRPDRFSLCVHGCDHTKGEFGNKDIDYLDAKVKLATARMIEHEKSTGVPFDRVMVFPQGIFSNEALEALKINSYLAAVNTNDSPIDGEDLRPKIPFYLRYSPENTKFIFDPIFIVLHHDYFKNGYEKLIDLIRNLNSQAKRPRWDSVGNIIRLYLQLDDKRDSYPDIDLSEIETNGYTESLKIMMRRYASEIRDNYISKNEPLLKYAQRIKSLMKL